MKISELKMRKIEETLKDFKCLLPRYREVMDNSILKKDFCVRNRNPIWDITNIKYFDTGLKSKGLMEKGGAIVKEHYITRVKSMEIIFNKLDMNPELSVSEFILLLKKHSSTISLTKDEHKRITMMAKKKDVMSYELYGDAGIVVPGLMELIN